MALHEFDIIAQYFRQPPEHPSIIKSVGDDCAVVSVPPNHYLAFSMDTLVVGRHFPENAPPEYIATRAFCTSLSDLAAMGAEPRWFTLGLTLPEAQPDWLTSFSRSLLAIAKEYRCELIGGDTTQGPLTVTLQVHGIVDSASTLHRDSAREGDAIYVTGTLGDGAAALDILQHDLCLDDADKQYLYDRFYQPEPQITLGQRISAIAGAAIDISDGVVADLQHIAKASQVDMLIDVECLPISNACHLVATAMKKSAQQYALIGGDDYQLAFTVPADNVAGFDNVIVEEALPITKIGKVISRENNPQVKCLLGGQTMVLDQLGYQHFAS